MLPRSLGVVVALLFAGCGEPESPVPPVGSNMTGVGMPAPTAGTGAAGTAAATATVAGTETGVDTTAASTTAPGSGGTGATDAPTTGVPPPPPPTGGNSSGGSVPTTGKELPEPTGGN